MGVKLTGWTRTGPGRESDLEILGFRMAVFSINIKSSLAPRPFGWHVHPWGAFQQLKKNEIISPACVFGPHHDCQRSSVFH